MQARLRNEQLSKDLVIKTMNSDYERRVLLSTQKAHLLERSNQKKLKKEL
jgi:hypothetical protein